MMVAIRLMFVEACNTKFTFANSVRNFLISQAESVDIIFGLSKNFLIF